jgi:hypothetical protein
MVADADDEFYNRADAVIHLANAQLESAPRGKVSASCMYGTARFNAWITACGFDTGSELAEAREETVEYFVKQYRAMLEEHLDDYIENFSTYMAPPKA